MDQLEYEALREKMMETYSVRPTLSHPEVKVTVEWHCIATACLNKKNVFNRRHSWIKHHKTSHNQRKNASDRDYPKEIEALRFVKERDLRELASSGAGQSAPQMPPFSPPATPNPAAPIRRSQLKAIDHQLQAANVNKPASRLEDHPEFVGKAAGGGHASGHDAEARRIAESEQEEETMRPTRNKSQTKSGLNRENEETLGRLARNKRHRNSPLQDAQGVPATPLATPVAKPVEAMLTWRSKAMRGMRTPAFTPRREMKNQAGRSRLALPADPNEGPAHPAENCMTPNRLEEKGGGKHVASGSSRRACFASDHNDQADPESPDDSSEGRGESVEWVDVPIALESRSWP